MAVVFAPWAFGVNEGSDNLKMIEIIVVTYGRSLYTYISNLIGYLQ